MEDSRREMLKPALVEEDLVVRYGLLNFFLGVLLDMLAPLEFGINPSRELLILTTC